MAIRYSDSLRCTIRAGVSVFGLQQIAQDTLMEAAGIDSREQHRLSCIRILQEMQE